MYYALLIIEKPDDQKALPSFQSMMQSIEQLPEGSQELPGNAFLLPLPASLFVLARFQMESQAREKTKGYRCSYALTFLAEKPEFTISQ